MKRYRLNLGIYNCEDCGKLMFLALDKYWSEWRTIHDHYCNGTGCHSLIKRKIRKLEIPEEFLFEINKRERCKDR